MNAPFSPTSPQSSRRGFTLVEMLIATTLLSLVMVGALSVLLQTSRTFSYETGKILVNKDIRTFTAEMTENATFANFFMIFPSYTSLTRSSSTLVVAGDPDSGYTTAITANKVEDGESGDCLVLVYKDPTNDRLISRLIMYFRAPTNASDPNSTGPVRRMILDITPSSSLPVTQLIPTISNPSLYPEVVELSRGLASGRLFYNFHSRSIIVKGELIHRENLQRQATNTYNFTVSPRG